MVAILGRTFGSWIGIISFYIIFYLGAAGMFVALLYGFMLTQDDQKPAFYGTGSLNAIPGVSVRPNPIYIGADYTTIHLDASREDTYKKHVQQLKDALAEYQKPREDHQIHCSSTNHPRYPNNKIPPEPNPESETCYVDITNDPVSGLGPCGCDQNRDCSKQTFGYDEGQPCIMLSINNVMNWYPEMWPYASDVPTDVAEDYAKFFKTRAFSQGQNSSESCWHRRVFIKCKGKTTEDQEHEKKGMFEYFPPHGIPFCFFPYAGQSHYQRPIIMVKVKHSPPSRAMTLLCTIYSKNIEPFSLGQEQVGENEVPLMVEETMDTMVTTSMP